MHVKLDVYNIAGRRIQTLIDQDQDSGNYAVTFFAYNLPSGIYYYQLKSEGNREIGQMLLLK